MRVRRERRVGKEMGVGEGEDSGGRGEWERRLEWVRVRRERGVRKEMGDGESEGERMRVRGRG